MYQIDVASAAATLPVPAAAGTPGFFTEGDPVSGAAATVVTADFLNAVMLELLGVVLGAGLTPSKTDRGQLLKAIRALTSGNLVGNGHLSIPVGPATLIVNWGSMTATGSTGVQPVTYDQAFQAGAFWTSATNASSGPPTAFHGTDLGNKTGMNVYSSNSSGAASPAGTAFRWLALGI